MIEAQLANMKEYGFSPTDENIMPTIEQIIKLAGIPCDEDDKKALFTDIEYAESITHKLGDCIFDDYEQKKWYFN